MQKDLNVLRRGHVGKISQKLIQSYFNWFEEHNYKKLLRTNRRCCHGTGTFSRLKVLDLLKCQSQHKLFNMDPAYFGVLFFELMTLFSSQNCVNYQYMELLHFFLLAFDHDKKGYF